MTYGSDKVRPEENMPDQELVRIVQAKQDEVSIVSALKELSKRNIQQHSDVFRTVLSDPEHNVQAKRTVVVALGTEDRPENRELLLRWLNVDTPSVFTKAVQSLGKIGDAATLERLENIAPPDEAIARQSLAFSRSLIAYRLRLNQHLISPPSPDDLVEVGDNGIAFEVENASQAELEEVTRDTRKQLPAISLTTRNAMKLTCRNTDLFLVFSDVIRNVRSIRTMRNRNALPVVLIKKGLSLDGHVLQNYFFTHPAKDDDRIVLLGTRPSGDLTYAGYMQISEDEIAFSLKSVDTRYAPAVDLEGRYDLGKRALSFTKALTSAGVAAREHTAAAPRKVTPRFD